jgi:MOSC domain-containing protein YiiM
VTAAGALRGEVVAVHVGRPADLGWRGRRVRSAIVKAPAAGPLVLGPDGFPGDEQADLRVHGGPDKAACTYPVEHRAGWEAALARDLPPGSFGENLALRGLVETDVHVGDVLAVGGALTQVSQPRGPCYKLAARWGRRELPARMAHDGRSGFYLRVLEPGPVAAGDRVRLVERRSAVSVAEVMRVTYRDRADPAALQAVLEVPELAEQWKAALRTLLARAALPLREFGT